MSREKIEVGSYIRAYDFQPREEIGDRYVEGTVTGVNEVGALEVDVAVDTAFGPNGREKVLVPPPGTLIFGEWDGRVTVVPHADSF